MSARVELPSYYGVSSDIFSVKFTTLSNGQIVMTYARDTTGSGDFEAFFTILNSDTSDTYFGERSLGVMYNDNELDAVATPDGGFALMHQYSANFKEITLFSADGVELLRAEMGGNGDGALSVEDDGTVLATAVFSSSTSHYVYAGEVSLFGTIDTDEWQYVSSASGIEVTVRAPIRIGGAFYTPVTLISNGGADHETRLVSVDGSSSNDLTLSSVDLYGSNFEAAEIRQLDNGNFMIVMANDGNSTDILIYDSTFTTQISSTIVTSGSNYGMHLIDKPDGTYKLVLLGWNKESARAYDIDPSGTVGTPSVESLGFTSGSVDLDGFFFGDAGWGLVGSEGSAPLDGERLALFDDGTPYADVEKLLSAGLLNGGGSSDRLAGSDGDDTLIGGAGQDGLWGFDGNDELHLDDVGGFFSYDSAYETAFGGQGNDLITDGYGSADMYGEQGNDTLMGGEGHDRAWGGQGADVIMLQGGNDKGFGGADSDFISGGTGNDTLWGSDGADLLKGGDGYDELRGELGRDILFGGGGDDKIFAGLGWDTINGGAGDDTMTGGGGKDVFVFTGDGMPTTDPEAETDLITDFVRGEDTIRIKDASGVSGYGDLYVEKLGGLSIVEYNDRQIIISSDIGASDFEFV